MGRNSDRVKLFKNVFEKSNVKTNVDELTKDLDYLNMTLNLALFETAFERAIDIKNIYGYPCIVTEKTMYLVVPTINNICFSTLEPTGRYKTINDEEILDRLVYEAETSHLLPKAIVIKIWTNIGLITNDDEDFKRTRGIPFRNKIHYYKSEIFSPKIKQ